VSDLDGRERAARLHLMAEQRRPVTLLPSALPYLDLIIGGSLLVPLGIANIVFTIMMLTGNTKYDPMIWLAWPALLAGAGVMVAIRRRRAWRVRAFGGALDRLGAEIGAVRLASFDDAIGWLNRHWPGSHGASDLFKGAIYAGIAGSYRGYPVMVEIEPDGYTDEGGTIDPRVLLYVAALAPAAFPAGGEIAPLRASIRDAGFEPELLADAGLRARASEATVKRLRRTPAALAELAPVVRDLVRLAEACGAAPAPSA
jgi:hypothetical protein